MPQPPLLWGRPGPLGGGVGPDGSGVPVREGVGAAVLGVPRPVLSHFAGSDLAELAQPAAVMAISPRSDGDPETAA